MGFMTGLAIASTAISGVSAINGVVQSNKAEKALKNLKVPELENPNRDIQISTLGSDLIKEEGQRQTANNLGSLQYGDARNMFTALPRLASMNNEINQKAALDIDRQMQQREYAIASYEERLNGIEENRYQGEIAGLGAMYNNGQQQMWNGIKGVVSGAGSLGRSSDNWNKIDNNTSWKKTVNSNIDNFDFSKNLNLPDYSILNS